DLARVRLVSARQNLDEGGLASPVLTEQAVHLARADLQIDPVERLRSGVVLHEAAHREQWATMGVVVHGSHSARPFAVRQAKVTWKSVKYEPREVRSVSAIGEAEPP